MPIRSVLQVNPVDGINPPPLTDIASHNWREGVPSARTTKTTSKRSTGSLAGSRFGFMSLPAAQADEKEIMLSDEEKAFCSEVANLLQVPPEVVEAFATRLPEHARDYDITSRLVQLGVVEEGMTKVQSVADLLQLGVDPQTMAATLTTVRGFPITDGASTFTSYLAEQGVVPAEEVTRILVESVREGVSTVQYSIDSGLGKTNAVVEALAEFSQMSVANRTELDGGPLDGPPEALVAAHALDVILWQSKSGDTLVLTERPVMDFALEAIGQHLEQTPEVRLISPRTFNYRFNKFAAVVQAHLPSEVEPTPEPEPEPEPVKTKFGSRFGLSTTPPKTAPVKPVSPVKAEKQPVVTPTLAPKPVAPVQPARPQVQQTAAQNATDTKLATALGAPDRQSLMAAIGTILADEKPKSRRGQTEAESVIFLPRMPVAQAVEKVISEALGKRATDIHFDPFRDFLRIRFRIDGLLHDAYRVDREMAREVIARVKILGELDITERRRAQDGQISMNIGGEEVDLRVATVPVKHGERVELRLANLVRIASDNSQLGLEHTNLEIVNGFLKQPHGIILATGPVGSGKTTTLYSCLNQLDSDRFNIMSIEDPVEVDIEGVNQVNVNYKINFDFVKGLRSLLRHDPDIILIGEIRDIESARIAIRAAMTGMLVFTSLHTNDAPGAITTLYNFNLPPHLVANALLGVVAQRLIRIVCDECIEAYPATEDDLNFLFGEIDERPPDLVLHRGRGCAKCIGSGYFGRTGIFEVLQISPTIRDMILEGASERALRDHAINQEGMLNLHMDARRKVLAGITSTEEAVRVLGR